MSFSFKFVTKILITSSFYFVYKAYNSKNKFFHIVSQVINHNKTNRWQGTAKCYFQFRGNNMAFEKPIYTPLCLSAVSWRFSKQCGNLPASAQIIPILWPWTSSAHSIYVTLMDLNCYIELLVPDQRVYKTYITTINAFPAEVLCVLYLGAFAKDFTVIKLHA